MKIETIICDIDGTLMSPGGGAFVDDKIKKVMIDLQKSGKTIVLASARIFQGVLPLALQIGMDIYGGYILSSNGTYAYDVKQKKILFCHEIKKEDALCFWEMGLKEGVDFGIAQPNYMVESGFSIGFYLDHFNCDVDVMITSDPKKYVNDIISKCSLSQEKEILDKAYNSLKEKIEENYPYNVIRSNDTFVDIVKKGCGKLEGLKELFTYVHLDFKEAAAIGDGNSDASMLQACAFSATLENGSKACKEVADIITPSYKEDGCLVFFEKIMHL